jgi:hypothetical protein
MAGINSLALSKRRHLQEATWLTTRQRVRTEYARSATDGIQQNAAFTRMLRCECVRVWSKAMGSAVGKKD